MNEKGRCSVEGVANFVTPWLVHLHTDAVTSPPSGTGPEINFWSLVGYVDSRENYGWTPLMSASEKGRYNITEGLQYYSTKVLIRATVTGRCPETPSHRPLKK